MGYKIISTCGISGLSIENEKRMNKMILAKIFYDLYKNNGSIEETAASIYQLIPKDIVIDLENYLKDFALDIYDTIKIDEIDKNKILKILDEKIKKVNDEKKKEVIIYCKSYIADFIFHIVDKESKHNMETEIEKYMVLDMKKFLRNISVECNALAFYIEECISEYRDIEALYFLASDSDLGHKAAENSRKLTEIMLKYIYDLNNDIRCKVCKVKGLNNENPEDFVKVGINDLLMKLFDIRYEDKNDICALSITGGFKQSIPYLVYFASEFNLELFYIFEHSEQGIILPRMPFAAQFDEEYLKKLEEVKDYFESGKIRQGFDKAKEFGLLSLIDKKEQAFSEFGYVLINLIKEKMKREIILEQSEERKSKGLLAKLRKRK